MIAIGEAMRKARESRGLTQKQLADLSGLWRSAISDYERGERFPSVMIAWSIADALGVTIDVLVGRCSG